MFKYTEDLNYPRYKIEIPEPIFEALSDYFFKPKEIFREEAQYLSAIFKEQFLDFEKLNEIKLSANLSLMEFFILKRLFTFFYYVFSKKVADKLKEEHRTIIRSLIPTFDIEKLHKFFKDIIGKQAINEFLNLVTWDPKGNTIFDVQYQPFIKTGEAYMVPICVFVKSNSIRNVHAYGYKTGIHAIMDDGKYDPIADSLEKAFKFQDFEAFKSIPHSFKGGGEIDFLAYKDDLLFVAECKKFLHPTSIYELRTIYDGLNKACDQLSMITEALGDVKEAAHISSLIGRDIRKAKTIRTSIVTNTRLFWGQSFNGHPIRNIYEIYNFIVTGNFRTEEGYYWLWENKEFTLKDLEKYLSEDFMKFTAWYDSMLQQELNYYFGKYNLTFETYVLNIEKLKESIKNLNLKKVEEAVVMEDS